MTQRQLATEYSPFTLKHLLHILGTPFRWWFTPRATTREEKFRERNLRLVVVLGAAVNLYSFIVALVLGLDSAWWGILDLLIYGIAVWCLVKRRVTLAGVILACYIIFYSMVDVSTDPIGGYSLTLFLISALAFALILPRNRLLALMLAVLTLAQNYHAVVYYLQGNASAFVDSGEAPSGMAVNLLFLNLSALMIGAMGYYLMHDYNAQRVELEDLVATLDQRVDERTRELKQARDEAEKANQIKSQFLASMSHELRTPLNAILNFAKLMRRGIMGPVNERQNNSLDEIVSSGQHLLNLINDVLDVSKIQSGMLTLFIEDNVDLLSILDTGVNAAESLVVDKPVAFVTDIDPDLPPMLCDQRRVRQILLNLLSNAVKFTDEGTITLSAKRKGGDILLAVSDTGTGISAEKQQAIFEPFIQTATGIKHAGGTGLGLAITKSLVEAHDGKIWLESTLGEGSVFMVSLPIESPRLRADLNSGSEVSHA